MKALPVIGVICGLSFIGKNLIQYFLDTYAKTFDGKKVETFFRGRVFLPYSYNVPEQYALTKKICNLLFYCFIITAVLYVLIWNLQ